MLVENRHDVKCFTAEKHRKVTTDDKTGIWEGWIKYYPLVILIRVLIQLITMSVVKFKFK